MAARTQEDLGQRRNSKKKDNHLKEFGQFEWSTHITKGWVLGQILPGSWPLFQRIKTRLCKDFKTKQTKIQKPSDFTWGI